MKTKVISVLTQKGGVGKTTTTIHLAASFAKKGSKVLVIDFDSQKNLSLGYKLDEDFPYTVVDFLEQNENCSMVFNQYSVCVIEDGRNWIQPFILFFLFI